MTYGIALKNEFDDNLVDQAAGLTFYKKSTGVCRLSSEVPVAGSLSLRFLQPATNSSSFPTIGITSFRQKLTSSPVFLFNDKIQYATPSFRTIIFRATDINFNTTAFFPDPVSTNKDDLIFFRMPADGIMSISQTFVPFTGVDVNGKSLNVGLHAFCVPFHTYSGPNLPFQVVSTDLPPASNGSHGLIVFDTNGSTILFDTTRDIVSFVDTVSVSAAQAQDIILNNASLTFNLRNPVANAWIASPGSGGTSFTSINTSSSANKKTVESLRIQQISSTQIRVNRAQTVAPNDSSFQPFDFREFQDALFIIGDFD